MKTSKIILLTILISLVHIALAQVAINADGSAPDESAILDLKSTTGGLLLPRMTNIQRDAIVSPAAGLFIFNTDESAIQFYDGSFWKYFNPGSCIPEQPNSITGVEYPDCNQTGLTYSIAEVAWASSYNWTVPSDATIASGQTTTTITVAMGTQSGNVSVRAESGCGNSSYENLPITIGIPSQPGTITGNAYPECNATAITYSIDAVNGALNYTWTVPSDAIIASGQGTTSITVDFGTNSENVSVRAENSCGNSNYTDLAISIGIPAQPGTISGNILPEPNATGETYSINPENGATTYNWTVPTDATIASGQGTTSITVDFGTTSGNVSVRAENSCGNSNYTDLIIIAFFTCVNQYTDTRNSQAYNTVLIGNQCWFAENLNIGTRIDGTSNQLDNSTIEKYCYDNDDANCTTYGGLYQWDEMMQYIASGEEVQGICPDGWHLPGDNEWKTMEMFLGMTQEQADATGYRGTDEGGKMKEAGTAHWNSPNTGATNSSGFTALPGGRRYSSGSFLELGYYGYWWSATEHSGADAWRRYLDYGYGRVNRGYGSKTLGYSVRCLKD